MSDMFGYAAPLAAAAGGGTPWFGYAGAASSLAGGIIGAFGAQAAGAGQAQGYLQNALSAGNTAANTMLALNRSDQQATYNSNRLYGRQRAAYGAGGIGAYTGSPLDVMSDTENQFKFEAMNRFYLGQEAARTASEQAQYDTEAAQAARDAADTGSFSSILGGIGSAVGIVSKFAPLALAG